MTTFLQVAGFGIAFILTFAVTKFIVELLGVYQFGLYSLILSASLFVRVLWYNVGASTFSRFWVTSGSEGWRPELAQFAMLCSIAPLALLLLPALMGYAKLDFALGDFHIAPHHIAAGIVLGVGLGANAILVEIENVSGNTAIAIASLVTPASLQLVCAAAAFRWGLDAGFVAMSTGMFLTATSLVHWLTIIPKVQGNWTLRWISYHHLRRLSSFSLPMMLWGVPNLLVRAGDRWVLALYLSATYVATFGAAVQLSQGVLAALATVANRAMLPRIFQLAGSGNDPHSLQKAHQLVVALRWLTIGAALGLSIAYFLAGERLLAALGVQSDQIALMLLLGLTLGFGCGAIADTMLLHGQIVHESRPYLLSRIVPPVAYFASLCLLLPITGAIGSLFAMIIYGFSALLFAMLATKRRFGTAYLLSSNKVPKAEKTA
jgi:O-antigen/teichoic acid export membrane protein